MSFPPATEMFQFAGFASHDYVFITRYRQSGGLPHSEILGSALARNSPRLIAACYVLHRLSVPRHPPNALHYLISYAQCQMRKVFKVAKMLELGQHLNIPAFTGTIKF